VNVAVCTSVYICVQVNAISHHGDEELCAVSQDLMRQHLNAARNCRILMQVRVYILYYQHYLLAD